MPPLLRDDFTRDYSTVQAALRSGVVLARTTKASHTWNLWLDFCTTHNVDPWFPDHADPIPYMQVFGQRYRDGRLAPGHKPVRARTVADALCLVGQTYKLLGTRDYRIDRHTGQIDLRLQRQFRAYEKLDPPPHRDKPVPIQLVRHVLHIAYQSLTTSPRIQAIADMICIAFFFLLRPGEYTWSTGNTPFRLKDATLFIGTQKLSALHTSQEDFARVTSASLTFTTQKNGVKGEIISHALSGDPLVCPCRAIVRRIQHLRLHKQLQSTPLCTYIQHNHPTQITAGDVRDTLRSALQVLGPSTLGIQPKDITARSLRAGGATALLGANIDPNSIQLLGRWKSDAMMRYLHISATPHTHRYAKAMMTSGQNPPANTQRNFPKPTDEHFSPPQEEFL